MMKPIGLIIIVGILALGGGLVVRDLVAPGAINVVSQLKKEAGILVRKVKDKPISQQMLPEFEFPDMDDKIHPSSEWQGKIRVINFWATWCPPCVKEIPDFIQLQEQYGSKNLQFIGIAVDDTESVKEFLTKTKINYPILIGDFTGASFMSLIYQLGNTSDAIPFTVIVNQKGEILLKNQGGISKEEILDVIQPLMN